MKSNKHKDDDYQIAELVIIAIDFAFKQMCHCGLYQQHCTMAQALIKFGIKDFAKIMTLAPIFSSQNYFR